MRDNRSGLPIPKAFWQSSSKTLLLRLCSEGSRWQWHFLKDEDTLTFSSRPPSPRWMRTHFSLLRGPRSWYPGPPPYKEVELVIPLASRPQVPEDTLWKGNQVWVDSFVAGWLLSQTLPSGRLTALSFTLRCPLRGKISVEKVGLLLHRHTDLPFDEKAVEVSPKRLSSDMRKRLTELLHRPIPYAYLVRLNDYFPSSLSESWHWSRLWHAGAPFPLPAELPPSSTPPAPTQLRVLPAP